MDVAKEFSYLWKKKSGVEIKCGISENTTFKCERGQMDLTTFECKLKIIHDSENLA